MPERGGAMGARLRELADEFLTVVAARGRVLDVVLPSVVFLVVNAVWGLAAAIWGSLGLAVTVCLWRLLRRQPILHALGGVGGVLLALFLSQLLGRAEGYFLPGMLNGAITALLCLVSVGVRRPLVAWTSHLARGWPLAWYWHPRVRPAYSEVTLAWAAFFLLRLLVQYLLFRAGEASQLALVNVLLGWPATILLLAGSYLYGIWRLQSLQGPSVQEFRKGAVPPWQGQKRGF